MATIDKSKCILVTGATSGIGRALALDIANLPSQPVVIGTGRRKERLEEIGKAGIHTVELNITSDFGALKEKVDEIVNKYPDLDTVILNAGVQHEFYFKKGVDMTKVVEEMTINYLSIVAFVNYIMPHFLKLSDDGRSTSIVIVTSGLSVVPAAWVPNYSASKAALHSFTMSLRAQVHDKKINVIEIVPPLVESELHDAYGTTEKLSKFWIPLSDFTKVTMEGLRKGDHVITMSNVKTLYEQLEQPKEGMVLQMMQKFEGAENHQ